MSASLVHMISEIARNAQNPQLQITFGELETYYPDTHSGIFRLPQHPDEHDSPIRVGPIPIGTFFAGPSIGAQFPPPPDAQALLIYIDPERTSPICAVFLFNADVDKPPYPDGKTHGFKDLKGSEIKTTDGGASLSDGAGGARVVVAGYASVVAPKVELGAEGRNATSDAVVTQQYLQSAINAALTKVQTAFNTLAAQVQGGPGVGSPSVGTVTAQGSSVVKAQA